MGVLDRFEKGMERAMSGAFSKFGRSEVKPVELASKLRKELDDRVVVVGHGRTLVPNEFTVELSPADYAQVQTWGMDTLQQELATNLTDYAASQHYAFVGPVSVSFLSQDKQPAGRMQVRSATVRGAVAPATAAESGTRHPLLDIDGQRYLLTGPVTVIGRDADADIVIDDPGISRRHLELRVTPEGVIATDLGSTNGLFVEGHQVPAATLLDGNTLTIGHTRIMFWTGAPNKAEAW